MNDEQLLRYSRQIMLPELDISGQQRLLDAAVLIIGLGGLGAPAALYLAAAGVGSLLLADHDEVELSNLQRQIIHQQESLGQPKVASAARTIAGLNPDVEVTGLHRQLSGEDLQDAVAGVDVVVDATDNFPTRCDINRACLSAGVPLVSGAAIRWEGQVAVFDPRQANSPCYQCLYPEADEQALNCAENGVVAPLVGIIGACQAMEALKLLTGVGDPLVNYVLYLDGKRMDWHKFKLSKNPTCPGCGHPDRTPVPALPADPP